MRFAVIGDLHSNLAAFQQALTEVRARGFDRLVLLGDCFTYGIEPEATFDLVRDTLERESAVLLMGNHDTMYVEDMDSNTLYLESLPDWIRESVEWTKEKFLSYATTSLPWRQHHAEENVFFAHANPHSFGDWSYLNNENDFRAAAEALVDRGFQLGVFGHTHRQKLATVSRASVDVSTRSTTLHPDAGLVHILNAGSPGQPRDANKTSSVMLLDVTDSYTKCEFSSFNYDVVALKKSIASSSLSQATKDKLLRFY